MGEIDRFNNHKKLVAFTGVDPSIFESDKFTALKIEQTFITVIFQLLFNWKIIWHVQNSII
ncbi:transposase [Gottfriedia acidiceleris]